MDKENMIKFIIKPLLFTHYWLMFLPPYSWTIGLIVNKFINYFDRFR